MKASNRGTAPPKLFHEHPRQLARLPRPTAQIRGKHRAVVEMRAKAVGQISATARTPGQVRFELKRGRAPVPIGQFPETAPGEHLICADPCGRPGRAYDDRVSLDPRRLLPTT